MPDTADSNRKWNDNRYADDNPKSGSIRGA